MKWLDSWIQRCYNRARSRDEDQSIALDDSPRPKWRGISRGPKVSSNHRVEHNFDDRSVITFKVYGANGGMIVETTRYDDKIDTERISRYVIDESADLSESLGKIVSMEYLK